MFELSKSTIIKTLASRLLGSPAARQLPLLETCTSYIEAHRANLAKALNLSDNSPASLIWDTLDTTTEMHGRISQLKLINRHVPSQNYATFVRRLYPSTKRSQKPLLAFDNLINKYAKVNHDMLFEAYETLPSPAPLHMKPADLEHLLRVFLHRRDFKYGHSALNAMGGATKPSSSGYLLPSTTTLSSNNIASSHKIIRAYKDTLRKRRLHTERCSVILNDVRKAGLPLSVSERNALFGMSFFKDKPEVVSRVESAFAELYDLSGQSGFSGLSGLSALLKTESELGSMDTADAQFNWESYEAIVGSFGEAVSIDTYNTALFAAIRHNVPAVVEDIHSRVVATQVINRKSVGLLVGYFAARGQADKLFDVIQTSLAMGVVYDTQTIDAVIDGLLVLGEVGCAETLFTEMFIYPVFDHTPSMYQYTSFEDGNVYREILWKYDQARAVAAQQAQKAQKATESLRLLLEREAVEQFKIYPTENTFYKLISYYADKGPATNIPKLVSLMESKFLLMPSTRIYKQMFMSCTSVDQLHDTTHRLLEDYYTSCGVSDSSSIKPPQKCSAGLQAIIEELQEGNRRGQHPQFRKYSYLKLSGDLVNLVFESYLSVVLDPSAIMEVMALRDELQGFELTVNDHELKLHEKVSQLTFLRRAYLAELLDIQIPKRDSIGDVGHTDS